jgi:hypothetical protein
VPNSLIVWRAAVLSRRAVPERSGVGTLADGSGEKTRGQAQQRSCFCLAESGNWNGKKQAGQVSVLKLIGISTQWAHSACLKRVKHGIGDLPTVSPYCIPVPDVAPKLKPIARSHLARRVPRSFCSKILSPDPFSTASANGHRLLPRSLIFSGLRKSDAVHESSRLIREIDKFSDHLRQIHDKAQVALAWLRKSAYKFSLAHDSDVAPTDHQASLRERFVPVLGPTEKIHDFLQ